MVKYVLEQSTDGYNFGAFDIEVEEPGISLESIPRARFTVPNESGLNAHILDIGKEIKIYRENVLIFTGLVESITPMKRGPNSDMKVVAVHSSYHALRREFCHTYDVDGEGNFSKSTSTDGTVINNWNYRLFRDPDGRLDVYGLPKPIDGVTPDEAIQTVLQEKSVFQIFFDSLDYMKGEDSDTANITVVPSESFGSYISATDTTSASTFKFIDLFHNDPNLTDNPVYSDVDVLLLGKAEAVALDDTAGSRDLTAVGSYGELSDAFSRFGTGVRISDGTYLKYFDGNTWSGMDGDCALTVRFYVDSGGLGRIQPIVSIGDGGVGETSLQVFIGANNLLYYQHDTGSAIYSISSTDKIGAGYHSITLRRDVSANTISIKLDGAEVISDTWGAGEDPASVTPSRLIVGQFHTLHNNKTYLEGGVTELRLWSSAVAQSTLDSVADPDDNTYQNTDVGSELASYYFELGSNITGNPSITVASGTTSDITVSLTRTEDYLGTDLVAWTGSTSLGAGSSTDLRTILSWGPNKDFKFYYIKIVGTASNSNFPVSSATITPYSGPDEVDEIANGAKDWIETDLLSYTRLSALERIRLATESSFDDNGTPHWDMYFDDAGDLNFVERRGSDIGLIYSFEQGNLETLEHEFYGAELAYQTAISGIGSGTEQANFVSKAEYYNGGLYESYRDPSPGAVFLTDNIQQDAAGYGRVKQSSSENTGTGFKIPHDITSTDVTFRYRSYRTPNPNVSANLEFTVRTTPTGTPIATQTVSLDSTLNFGQLNEITFSGITLSGETQYYVMINATGTWDASDQILIIRSNKFYAHGTLVTDNVVQSDKWLGFQLEFTPPAADKLYGDLPRKLRFVDSNEKSVSMLLHKGRVFHKLHRNPIESLTVKLQGEHIRYFQVGDRLQFEDLETRTNSLLRVVGITRKFTTTETITVTLGEAPATATDRIAENEQQQNVITLKAKELKNLLKVSEDDGSFSQASVSEISFDGDLFDLSASGTGVNVDANLDMGEW